MICLLNPFRNASKLADVQTELAFLNNADISEPSTTTDICKGSWMGYLSRFLCFQDRNSLTCFTLFISRGGGRSLPGTGPGGGKVANSRSRVSAALRGKDCVIYWKGGAKALKKEMNSSWKNVEQSWGIRDREPLQGL